MLYAFILENDSLKEILKLLLKQGIKYSILSLSQKVLVIKIKKPIRITKLPKRVKLVKILEEYKPLGWPKFEELRPEFYDKAPAFLETKELIIDSLFKSKVKKRITFALSFYDFEYLRADFVNHLGKRVKDDLKIQGIETKFILVKEIPYLSQDTVLKNRLPEEGVEIVIIKKQAPSLCIYLGKTEKAW